MRGIVLAGGTGSRLGDLTKVVNKHLLPVGGKPMIYWPIQVLQDNGIGDITIVSPPKGIGQLAELLGSGYTYRVQDKPGGIAHAIACAQTKSDEQIIVILGDNVFLPSPSNFYFRTKTVACCFVKEVLPDQAKEFGIATFKDPWGIDYITEKPEKPESNFAVTGLYIFSPDVFGKISTLGRSNRGEVEVTDLLNLYAKCNQLDYFLVTEFWGDAGTLEGLERCADAVRINKKITSKE